MSARTAAPVRTHLVVGERDQVVAALWRAQADGRLMRLGEVDELGGHRVQVTAELREPPGPVHARWAWRIAAGVLCVAAAAGLVWLLVVAVTALIGAVSAAVTAALGWLSAHLPLLVLGGVALLLLPCSAGSRCVGLHCGGCRG
jgi:hypothetical protein